MWRFSQSQERAGIQLQCLVFSQMQQSQSDGQISRQLQSFPSSKQDTLSTFYIQIGAISHRSGLVYTAARGKDVGGKMSCLCLHLNFWCFGNKYLRLIPRSIRLPVLLRPRISESRCTLNSYALVSYGYNLRWRAGVPFPFSALRAQPQRSRDVQ